MTCIEVQEQLAWGRKLTEQQRLHVADCAECTNVATSYCLLDETLGSLAAEVPVGFADRVMARVKGEQRDSESVFARRWVQFAFVYGGMGVAAFNVVRFLLGVLVPSVGLGGTR